MLKIFTPLFDLYIFKFTYLNSFYFLRFYLLYPFWFMFHMMDCHRTSVFQVQLIHWHLLLYF